MTAIRKLDVSRSHYDSGWVFPAGPEVGLQVVLTNNTGEVGATLRGYLTYN
jgi:hypothetical protein